MPWALALLAGLAGVSGCDDPVAAEEALMGLWQAVEYEFTAAANPGRSEDIIAEGGSYLLNLLSGGAYQWQYAGPEGNAAGDGTFQIRDETLILTPAGGVAVTYDYAFADPFLVLTTEQAMYDFGSGSESARLRVTLESSFLQNADGSGSGAHAPLPSMDPSRELPCDDS